MRQKNQIETRQNGKVLGILLFYLFTFLPLSAQQIYTLEQIKDSALHNNIAIRSAKYNIATAQQQRKEAFTKYFPNVSGTGLWFGGSGTVVASRGIGSLG